MPRLDFDRKKKSRGWITFGRPFLYKKCSKFSVISIPTFLRLSLGKVITEDTTCQKEPTITVVGSIPMKEQNVLQDHRLAFLRHST